MKHWNCPGNRLHGNLKLNAKSGVHAAKIISGKVVNLPGFQNKSCRKNLQRLSNDNAMQARSKKNRKLSLLNWAPGKKKVTTYYLPYFLLDTSSFNNGNSREHWAVMTVPTSPSSLLTKGVQPEHCSPVGIAPVWNAFVVIESPNEVQMKAYTQILRVYLGEVLNWSGPPPQLLKTRGPQTLDLVAVVYSCDELHPLKQSFGKYWHITGAENGYYWSHSSSIRTSLDLNQYPWGLSSW